MNATKRAHITLMSEAIRLEAIAPGWGFSWAVNARDAMYGRAYQPFAAFEREAFDAHQRGFERSDKKLSDIAEHMAWCLYRAVCFRRANNEGVEV